jgi:hypothetical protein
VKRTPFVVGLGFAGLLVAVGTYAYVRRRSNPRRPGGIQPPIATQVPRKLSD